MMLQYHGGYKMSMINNKYSMRLPVGVYNGNIPAMCSSIMQLYKINYDGRDDLIFIIMMVHRLFVRACGVLRYGKN